MTRRKSPPTPKEEAEEIHDDVQQCPQCGHWYSAHSAVPCFACAVGMDPY